MRPALPRSLGSFPEIGGRMRRTARHYWGGLLVVGLLVLPAFDSSDTPLGWSPSHPVPFLAAASAQRRALQTLSSSATIPAISLMAPLPVAGDSKPAAVRPAARTTVRGSSASLITPAATVVSSQTSLIVQDGETLWQFAQIYGVTVEALAAANDIGNDDVIQVGQGLVIPGPFTAWAPAAKTAASTPPSRGMPRQVTVVVGEGETLWEIAQVHGLSVDAIVEANELRSGDLIQPGQRLVIPGRPIDIPRRVTAVRRGAVVSIAQSFIWPARGALSSRFGWRWQRHHNGIDIAAPYGTQIYAAKAGRVTFSGWYYGYGRAVIIDHGDGLSTVYGHASKLLVRVGDMVGAGQPIALVGSTGIATGPHLHFEIRVNGRPLNPLKYL